MKTITIDDKTYEFLVNTGREILTQDNRCTAKPIVFLVQAKHEEVRPEECSDKHKIIDDEGAEIETPELVEDILSNATDAILKNIFLVEFEDIEDGLRAATSLDDIMEIVDIDDYIKQFRAHWRHVYFDEEHRYGGEGAFFLTEKACHAHIDRNKHNYDQPRSYVEHAYRNPEIEQLCRFLTDLATAVQNQPETNEVSTVRAFTNFLNPDELKDMQQIQETKNE